MSYKEPYTRVFTLLAWGSLLKYIQFLSFFLSFVFFNYTNIFESISHQTTLVKVITNTMSMLGSITTITMMMMIMMMTNKDLFKENHSNDNNIIMIMIIILILIVIIV